MGGEMGAMMEQMQKMGMGGMPGAGRGAAGGGGMPDIGAMMQAMGGGGGGGMSGLVSSKRTASTGPLITFTNLRASPELMAQNSRPCNTTTTVNPTMCLRGVRCRLA